MGKKKKAVSGKNRMQIRFRRGGKDRAGGNGDLLPREIKRQRKGKKGNGKTKKKGGTRMSQGGIKKAIGRTGIKRHSQCRWTKTIHATRRGGKEGSRTEKKKPGSAEPGNKKKTKPKRKGGGTSITYQMGREKKAHRGKGRRGEWGGEKKKASAFNGKRQGKTGRGG